MFVSFRIIVDVKLSRLLTMIKSSRAISRASWRWQQRWPLKHGSFLIN